MATEITDAEKDAFFFLNRCLLGRNVVRKRFVTSLRKNNWKLKSYTCDGCGEKSMKVHHGVKYYDFKSVIDFRPYLWRPKTPNEPGYFLPDSISLCDTCYERYLSGVREKRGKEAVEHVKEFSDQLEGCTKSGTCDILYAHHVLISYPSTPSLISAQHI